jgi:Ca-activated chloride channel homolog
MTNYQKSKNTDREQSVSAIQIGVSRGIALMVAIAIAAFLMGLRGGYRTDPLDDRKTDPHASQEEILLGKNNSPDLSQTGAVSTRRNLYFIFDGSGSMAETPQNKPSRRRSERKLDGARRAVKQFLTKIPTDVNLGLYVFDAIGESERVPLATGNRKEFISELDAIQANGATPLGAALKKGSEALAAQYRKQLGYGEYLLIVVTDGDATDSLLPGVKRAENYRFPIYTIGYDMNSDHALRSHSLSYRSATSEKELEKALNSAVAELDSYRNNTVQPSHLISAAAKRRIK